MKILLSEKEHTLLKERQIHVEEREYTEDEVFEILDLVYDAEAFYSQDSDTDLAAGRLAKEYADIADMIQSQIPEK